MSNAPHGDGKGWGTRSPLILAEFLLPFTIHPLPGGKESRICVFLDRRMTPHLHSRRSPAYCRVDRVVESTGAFLAFSCLFVVVAFAALLQASGRIRLSIFETLCLSIRTFARVLIGMLLDSGERAFSRILSRRHTLKPGQALALERVESALHSGYRRPCSDIWVWLGSVDFAFGSTSQRSRSE